MNRSERRKQQTRVQLKQAANDLLLEVGYAGLTIKGITDRADLGYGTFYLHFHELDEIVWSLIQDFADSQIMATTDRLQDVPYPRREYLSWLVVFEVAEQTRESIVALFGKRGSARLLQRYQDYLAAVYEENMRAGRYSSGLNVPVDFLAQMMAGAMIRLLVWWAENETPYSAVQMADMLYETVFREPPPDDQGVGNP